jgi:hypothetical protein
MFENTCWPPQGDVHWIYFVGWTLWNTKLKMFVHPQCSWTFGLWQFSQVWNNLTKCFTTP